MALTNVVQAKDIDGLLPALDVRQPGKEFILDGKNFKWTVQGPESSFGSRYIGYQNILDPELGETFRLSNSIIFCGSMAFYQYDPTSQTFYPLYFFGTQPDEYPWTACQILSKFYFCRKGLGVFEFNPATNHWRQLTPAGLPTNPVAICAVRGRLVVLGTSAYKWSAIENPDDFTDSLATGVASQFLSIIGGDAFSIRASTDGFLVYTSAGIVAAEFADNQAVFRHTVLTRVYKAINPFCIVEIDEGKQLFCDKKGLFTTTGGVPEPFMPLFGEYLNKTLLTRRDLGDFSVFRMHHAKDQQLLFFMVCLPSDDKLYEKSYCIDIPTQKLGSFDRLHYGFGELNLGSNSFYDYNFGFIDHNGYFHRFTGEPFNEISERPAGGYFFHTDFDMPARRMEDVYFFPSLMNLSSEPEYLFNDRESGFYAYGDLFTAVEFIDEEQFESEVGSPYLFKSSLALDAGFSTWGAIKADPTPDDLDAYIHLGLFRFSELKAENELGEILQLSVHSGELPAQEEDWLSSAGEEDLLTSTLPDEDWGLSIVSGDDYKVTLVGTNDGYTTFETHSKELINIAVSSERVKRFPGDMVKGLFHILKITAQEFPETFHIKIVELTGMSAGRIN